jgi:hypothetical protein
MPSEIEYYAIPVSPAQDKLKHIKCQLKYVPIYFLLCFCRVSFTSFSLAQNMPHFYLVSQLPHFFTLILLCVVAAHFFIFSCAFAAFLPCFFYLAAFFISLLPAHTYTV